MNNDSKIAISVSRVSKTFKIPHEKVSSLRGAFVNVLKKGGYEEFNALDNVSFEVKKGEFFGIIGRNGSGKSTLLKILAGIYQADKGRVHINGRISPFLELGIGFNPELSGRDNIYLNAAVLGLSHKKIIEKFDSIVEFSELERFIDQKLKNYSSGMQVRLAFSVAIHANREILLMDEVLAVGDSSFQRKCLNEFNKYKEMGKTVVLVSHDISTIQKYCDRVLLLENGKIVSIGKSDEVVHEYMCAEKEKRGEREKQQNAGIKNSPIEITKVEFLDKEKQQVRFFETGDDITARIFYRANEKVEQPIFGVAVHSQEGAHLSGPNTETSNFEINTIKRDGFIDCTFKNNPFFSGMFYLTVAVYSKESQTPFDYREKEFVFNVQSTEVNQHGMIKIETVWNQ